MAKPRSDDRRTKTGTPIGRRDFVKTSAAAGVGAAALFSGHADAQAVHGRQQVVDMQGAVIPGLYPGGEGPGGFDKHGLGKGTVQGYIAGTHAAVSPT